MNQKKGKVIEVYIPKEYKNDTLIDVMDSNKIGFKIQLDDNMIDVIQQQNDYNCNIVNGDYVIITKQVIDDIEFTDIELYGGDEYE